MTAPNVSGQNAGPNTSTIATPTAQLSTSPSPTTISAYASFPPAASVAPGTFAYDTVLGQFVSNGSSWVGAPQRRTVAKMRAMLAQAQAGVATPATAQPLIAPAAWVTATAYTKGMAVTNGGNTYGCIVSGTSASAPAVTTNGAIVDGTAQWYYMGPSFSSNATAPTYTPAITLSVVGSAGNSWTNTLGTRTDGAAQIRDTSVFQLTGNFYTETGTSNALIGGASGLNQIVSFMTDSPTFAIAANGGSSWNSQIYVNGVPLTLGFGSATAISGSIYYHQLQFATRTPRLITYEMLASNNFWGVVTSDKTSKVWAPSNANSFRVAVTGTSYITGSVWHPITNSVSWGGLLCKMLNCTDYWQDPYGAGSGYIATGGFGNYSAPLRFNAMIAYNPDVVIVAGGGINDRSNLPTVAGEQAAVLGYLQAVRVALPSALILVIGSESGSTGPAANVFQMELGVQQAVAQFNDPFCLFIPQSSTVASRAWISGTGNATAPNTTGSADLYISVDTIHPVQAGVFYMAYQSAAGVISALNSLSP